MNSPTYDILVVDDSAVMRAMLIRVLRLSGLPIGNVHEAGDGARALEVLREKRIGLALVDINMPIMNGDELLDQIRATPELVDLPVLIVSTEHSDTRIDSVKRRGAGFVHKPFTPEQIRAAALSAIGVTHA
jgi:two-component system, chemotaxis family, chemotaxis protein CheY